MAFDAALSVDQATLDALASSIYSDLYPKLFRGSVNAPQIAAVAVFDIKRAPTFTLNAPAGVSTRIRADLATRITASDAAELDALSTAVSGATFTMTFPRIDLTITGPQNIAGSITFEADVICQAVPSGSSVAFEAVSATANASTDAVSLWILQQMVLPWVVDAAGNFLQGIKLPPLTLGNVSLGPMVVGVQQGRVLALSNLRGEPVPTIPTGITWPGAGFFLVLGPNLLQTVASTFASSLSYNLSDGGSIDLDITTLHYSFSVSLHGFQLRVTGPTSLIFTARLSGSGGGSFRTLWNNHITYDLGTSPAPTGNISLSMNGPSVIANVDRVDPVILTLDPTGSGWGKFLSEILSPLTNAISGIVSPWASSQLHFSFKIWTIPPVNVNQEGVNLTFSIVSPQLGHWGDFTLVTGMLQVKAST